MKQENLDVENNLVGIILVDYKSEYSGIIYGIVTKITKNHVFIEWHKTWGNVEICKHSIKLLKSWLEIYRVISTDSEKAEYLATLI